MSNQIFSNDTNKYSIDGAQISVLGLPLTSYLNQPVLTTSSPTFGAVTAPTILSTNITSANISSGTVSATTVSAINFQNGGSVTIGPGNIPTYSYLQTLTGTGIRERILSIEQSVVGAGSVSLVFNNLPVKVGSVVIKTAFASTAGSFVGQYGSIHQIARFSNLSGTVVPGANLQLLSSRDAGLVGVATVLLGSSNTLTVNLVGQAGETINFSGTVEVYM